MRWVKGTIRKKTKSEMPIKDKVGALNDEFEAAKNEIIMCYMDSMINGDTATQKDLKNDMASLRESYDEAIAELINNKEE